MKDAVRICCHFPGEALSFNTSVNCPADDNTERELDLKSPLSFYCCSSYTRGSCWLIIVFFFFLGSCTCIRRKTISWKCWDHFACLDLLSGWLFQQSLPLPQPKFHSFASFCSDSATRVWEVTLWPLLASCAGSYHFSELNLRLNINFNAFMSQPVWSVPEVSPKTMKLPAWANPKHSLSDPFKNSSGKRTSIRQPDSWFFSSS